MMRPFFDDEATAGRRQVAGTALLVLALAGCGSETPPEPPPPNEGPPGVALRTAILTTPVSELGYGSDAEFPRVYGALTDWSLGEHTASVVSMRDGAASLYTTATFGVIGGEGHESVRSAAVAYVQMAERFVDTCPPVSEFPYPDYGEVYYYLLTYDGVRRCVGDEKAIDSGSDPTRPLFVAAQEVITQLRLAAGG